jgi:hypothetical protein
LQVSLYESLVRCHLPAGFLHTAGATISLAQLKVHGVVIGGELFGFFQVLDGATRNVRSRTPRTEANLNIIGSPILP